MKFSDKFSVLFQYGRVGNTLTSGTKTLIPVDEAEANKVYDKLIKDKKGKGYKEKELPNEKKN